MSAAAVPDRCVSADGPRKGSSSPSSGTDRAGGPAGGSAPALTRRTSKRPSTRTKPRSPLPPSTPSPHTGLQPTRRKSSPSSRAARRGAGAGRHHEVPGTGDPAVRGPAGGTDRVALVPAVARTEALAGACPGRRFRRPPLHRGGPQRPWCSHAPHGSASAWRPPAPVGRGLRRAGDVPGAPWSIPTLRASTRADGPERPTCGPTSRTFSRTARVRLRARPQCWSPSTRASCALRRRPGPSVTGSAPGGSVPPASMELGVSGQEVVGERIDDAAQDLDGLPAATIG
ncbi:hypothetical protein H4687_009008 [Streptomyces stelliscabiei]|uniref:Uncharacterized protein n=1 Tax=Streptomyces stelliscabiei TaxID=146820 RepID=A0A8I0PHQ8_9ACTN|nr:hypothetical protein [Streptomyces stelliscabiei]